MPLLAGAVTISAAGVASGVGLAKEIYDDYLPKVSTIPAGAAGVTSKQQLADLCNSFASKTLAHIMANALVTTPLGVLVQVTPATGTGATTAPGLGSVT